MGASALQAADMSDVDGMATTTQHTNIILNMIDPNSDQLYRNYEVDVEGFGMGTVNARGFDDFGNYHHRHFQAGLGAGVEAFFNRYVGIEAEGFSESTHHDFVNNVDGNLVLRLPIGETGLAPYIFGGGGYQWEPPTPLTPRAGRDLSSVSLRGSGFLRMAGSSRRNGRTIMGWAALG